MQKMMSCKWHDQVFSFCSESHAAVCIWTTTVHALHCISLAVCNKAICHIIKDLLRWNLKYLLKTTGLISISVSQQQAPNPKENRWLYMQKYHILIHVQERFHITLGRCPEDEHNIIFSVVLWEAHNPNTGTNVQDSSWETAANLFKTRHPVNANNKQSIVIYQNKLHFCVLFYIWFFFSSIFKQFPETSKDILFVEKFILEDIFNFTTLFSRAYKIWKYKSSTKYLRLKKKIIFWLLINFYDIALEA